MVAVRLPLRVVTLFLGFAHIAVITNCKLSKRWEALTVKHSWAEPPEGWEYIAPAPADYVFDLKIGMKQSKLDELIANLIEISDPQHTRYTEHLTKEQVEGFTMPHPDSVQIINKWLVFHGINSTDDSTRRSQAGDWIIVRVTVEQAERMLGAKYHVYKHGSSGDQVVRTLSYSLPEVLDSHVDLVTPTTLFGTLRSMKSTNFLKPTGWLDSSVIPPDSPNCEKYVTPGCLRSLYNTKDYVPRATGTNKLGIAGFLDQFAIYADLQTFLQDFRNETVGSNFSTVLVHGGGDDQSIPGIEGNLDTQYTIGISAPTPNIYYSTGGSPPFIPDSATLNDTNEPYLDFLSYILGSEEIPQVLTVSYGDDEQAVPPEYAARVCNGFAALGARGTTVFFASGDNGVGAGDCHTNDGKNQTIFQPNFPASCPYVTAVGGTYHSPEVAANFSGGGFSRYFSRPAYQDTAVTSYFSKLGCTHEGLYNRNGRAYPDISAQAANFQVIVGGEKLNIGGTSASSPTVAAIFSLLNDMRLSSGKKSLGFINPFIYSTAQSGFNDITVGTNPGCNTTGFPAGPGWDPVTGLGTPDFAKLQKLMYSNSSCVPF